MRKEDFLTKLVIFILFILFIPSFILGKKFGNYFYPGPCDNPKLKDVCYLIHTEKTICNNTINNKVIVNKQENKGELL